MTAGAADLSPPLLGTDSAVAYLQARGVLGAGPMVARLLGGGVSNVVIAAGDDSTQVVVKQALARLRVADEWLAPPERAMTEADALAVAGELTPGHVPRVLDRDPARHALVVERAPRGWTDWKTAIFSGTVDPRVAATLGGVLARWHTGTAGPSALPTSLEGNVQFEMLRVDPYYRTVAARAPELQADVLALVDQMAARRTCLVHGDFSPKNVLCGPGGLWVIDFEVAHRGDPAFDLAFLLCHLTLKSFHLPAMSAELDACTEAFVAAYRSATDDLFITDWSYVFGHLGCLLLARVRGKSPAEYLGPAQQDMAWRLGRDLVQAPPPTLQDVHRRRDQARS